MPGFSGRRLEQENMARANISSRRGSLQSLSRFICPYGNLNNFVITGGCDSIDRYLPLYETMLSVLGRYPVIVLHSGSPEMEQMMEQAWAASGAGEKSPLWIINNQHRDFEPFYGMQDSMVVSAMRRLAAKLNYTIPPEFEQVVRAHLEILHLNQIPVSLTAMNYLAGFTDMGEFYGNIMELPCSAEKARSIWSDVGTENAAGSLQMFRSVVQNLMQNAEQSGWSPDSGYSDCNCITAIRQNASVVLSVDDYYSELMLPYLLEELKALGRQEFLLVIDDVKISDPDFLDYLGMLGGRSRLGLVSQDFTAQLSGDEKKVMKIRENAACYLIFKHRTSSTADVLSRIMGNYDAVKEETTSGNSQSFFSFLPSNRHSDVHIATENRCRVMPNDIISLQKDQAIIFDTTTDQIIYYN